jgi:orsellinic acid C2-O-methyltransferase
VRLRKERIGANLARCGLHLKSVFTARIGDRGLLRRFRPVTMRDGSDDATDGRVVTRMRTTAMADFTRVAALAVAAAYDFKQFGTIVDVGGGNGALMIGILNATPGPRGIVYDQPSAAARATQEIKANGLADRCTAVVGDFFKNVPPGGDAYLLKHVIHDWDDERATTILSNCRSAMGAQAKLLIVEGVYPARMDQSIEGRGAAANDVNMLISTGGRQRSESEFRGIFEASGFRLTKIVPTPVRVSVIEGILI